MQPAKPASAPWGAKLPDGLGPDVARRPWTGGADFTPAKPTATAAAKPVSPAVAELNLKFLNDVTDSARFLWSDKSNMKPEQQAAVSLDFFKQLLADPKNAAIPLDVKQKALTRFLNSVPENLQGPLREAMYKQDPTAFEKDPRGADNNVFALKNRLQVVAQSSVGDGDLLLLQVTYNRLMSPAR